MSSLRSIVAWSRRPRIGRQRHESSPPAFFEPLESRVLLNAGDLDPTFGTGGVVFTDVEALSADDSAKTALLTQPDGKLLVVGWSQGSDEGPDVALARYMPDGSLDLTFGTDGKKMVDFTSADSSVEDAALQADGRIVIVSERYVARLNADGTPDTSFGIDGVNDSVSFRRDPKLDLQSDGRILVFDALSDFRIHRFLPNGDLDSGFGVGGVVTTDMGGTEYWGDILVLDDDRFVVTGLSDRYNIDYVALAKYQSDGTLDLTFGTGGKAAAEVNYAFPRSLAVQSDGSLIVAGRGAIAGSSNRQDFTVVRFSAAGVLDTGFGTNGVSSVDFNGGDDAAYTLAVQDDQRIVVGGIARGTTSVQEWALIRLDTSGQLDTTFGDSGKAVLPYGPPFYSSWSLVNDIVIQDDDRIVAVGFARDRTSPLRFADNFQVARYLSDGSLDPSFGGTGVVQTDFIVTGVDIAEDVVVRQPDGKIIVAGTIGSGTMAVLRYNTDGSLDQSFGNGGIATVPALSSLLPSAVMVLPYGRIAVVGSTGGSGANFFVLRLHSNGAYHSWAQSNFAARVFGAPTADIQSDGKIVIAGWGRSGVTIHTIVARFHQWGGVDTSFGDGGYKVLSVGSDSRAYDVAVTQDDKIILAGVSTSGSRVTERGFLIGYDADGTPLPGFGAGGVISNVFGDRFSGAHAVAIDSENRIIVSGRAYTGATGGQDFATGRFHTSGDLDVSFGSNGFVFTDFGSGNFEEARAIVTQLDGGILIAGKAFIHRADFVVAQYTVDGVLNTSFGNGGSTLIDFGPDSDDELRGMALAADGSIVLAGYSRSFATGKWDMAIVRLTGSPIPPAPAVESIEIGSGGQSVIVGFSDVDLDAATATDVNNYTVIAANGDLNGDGNFFNDGDEIQLTLTSASYDVLADNVVVQSSGVITDDVFKVVVDGDNAVFDGTTGVRSTAGRRFQGGDTSATFDLSKRPMVVSVDIGRDLQSAIIQFDDVDLDAVSAADVRNYAILAANGDANGDSNFFNDGDETTLAITGAVYDAAKDQVVVSTSGAIFDDVFRVKIDGDDASDGSPGVTGENGRHIEGGDQHVDFDLISIGMVNDLLDRVEALGLSMGAHNSLVARLDAAVHLLGVDPASNSGVIALMNSFTKGVDLWFTKGQISQTERDSLFEDAHLIILGLTLLN